MKRLALALACLTGASAARAQEARVAHDPDFDVERLQPAPGAGGFWQVEDADILLAGELAFGAVSSLSADPLVVRDVLGGPNFSEPVALRLDLDALAAIGVGERWQLGVALPFVVYQSGDRLQGLGLTDPGAEDALRAVALRDPRLYAKWQIIAAHRGYGWGVAADGIVTLPLGDQAEFAGERGFVLEARLIASLRRPGWDFAANLGPRFRTAPIQFLSPAMTMGNELAYGVAGARQLPWWNGRTRLVGELAGSWGGSDGPSPTEARLGLRWQVDGAFLVGASIGVGLGDERGIGAPAWRGMLELRWDPHPHPDADGDGIPDAIDKCPFAPEDKDGFQDADGCPDPDNDGDGIPDTVDQCPNEPEDFDNFRDWDGCPDPDNDGDGIPDVIDKCPNDPEDFDGWQDADGCPENDNDGDGIPDKLDKCPNEPEDVDGFQDADGCPDPDNDGDGIPDVADQCPNDPEDKDGWQDADGCPDLDDDRDGVPDAVDKCLDAPETITSPTDVEQDGCPDGTPMVTTTADGAVVLAPVAQAALRWAPGETALSKRADVVVLAVARAVHRAAWDTAKGDALIVSMPGDGPTWSAIADARTQAVIARLAREGVHARAEARVHPAGVVIHGLPHAVEAGAKVPVRGQKVGGF